MAVTLNAQGTSDERDAATGTFDVSGHLTIAAGSNRALIVNLIWSAAPGTVAVIWDFSGAAQAMTQIGTNTTSPGGRVVQLWGLVAPGVGSLGIRITYTNTVDVLVEATAYDGVDQTGGTTSFAHFASASGTSTTASTGAITSAVNNLTHDVFTAPVGSATPNQTQNFFTSGAGGVDGGSSRAVGAASNTHTWTISSTAWASAGVDIVAVGGGAVTVALEWKQPTSQPTNHFVPTIVIT